MSTWPIRNYTNLCVLRVNMTQGARYARGASDEQMALGDYSNLVVFRVSMTQSARYARGCHQIATVPRHLSFRQHHLPTLGVCT